MALLDYEVELQMEIIAWKCSRRTDCVMKFIRKPRHMKLGMKGLLWSIEALPISGPAFPHINKYTFNIMEVKRSATPLSLYHATQPELPDKLKPLQVGLQISMSSVFQAGEALDKLYAFSSLFSHTGTDERWWMIVDAKIAATACVTTRVAVLEAAMAAVAVFPPPPVNPTSSEDVKVSYPERAIERWTPADELWAMSLREPRPEVRQRIEFLSVATERGDVLQWCGVHVIDSPHPSFEMEVEVDQFLKGDDVVLRIGVFSHRTVRVRVSLTDNVEVVCSQEGVESQSSVGLGYLLPELVRDYIKREANCSRKGFNVVEGALRLVVGYLGLLRKKCVVCGSDRLLAVPRTSACDNICKARKEEYEAVVAVAVAVAGRREKREEGVLRREEYVREMFSNTSEGRTAVERVVNARVVASAERKEALEAEEKKRGGNGEEIVEYEEAVRRSARKSWRSIAATTRNSLLKLWRDDEW